MIFDGFMIYKDYVKKLDINELLIKLENEVNDQLEYKIKLIIKEMNNIIKVPDDYFAMYKEIDTNNLNIIKTDLEAANIILNILDNILFLCKNIDYYKYDNSWINDLKQIRSLLKSFIMNRSFVKYKKATKNDVNEG